MNRIELIDSLSFHRETRQFEIVDGFAEVGNDVATLWIIAKINPHAIVVSIEHGRGDANAITLLNWHHISFYELGVSADKAAPVLRSSHTPRDSSTFSFSVILQVS